MEPQGIDVARTPPGPPAGRRGVERPTVSRDGKFFRPAGSRPRCLILVEASDAGSVEAAARAGADHVVVRQLPAQPVFEAAAGAGLTVAVDAGSALAARSGGGLLAGARAGLGLRSAARDTGLWLAFGEDDRPFMRGALRALRFEPREALLAGPITDDGRGRCAGQAVAARFAEREVDELLKSVAAVQIAARRRPVVAQLSGGEGLPERLGAAADLGCAALIVPADPDGRHLEAVRGHLAWERERLRDAPLISVLVCSHNEEATIGGCLRSLECLDYPSFEVIVADDGSSDATREVARRAGVRVLELERGGLSVARNAAARAARGAIVAFLDADAAAHPDWLEWLWRGFDRLGADGVSGPNYPFPGAGLRERAVAGAPGAPVPAVNPDGSATHLPGCSMAFRRELVLDIGFEEGTSTGEDVVFCTEALRRGARLAYHPTAAIDHHRRTTITGYLRQQRSYGALLSMDENAHAITTETIPDTPLRSRVNPLKRRHIFSGAQEEGLYAQRAHGANTLFPLKLMGAVALLQIALAPVALIARRPRQWALCGLASLTAVFAWIAACVPAPAGARGAAGVLQRAVTAYLWLAKPVVHRLGERSARRSR